MKIPRLEFKTINKLKAKHTKAQWVESEEPSCYLMYRPRLDTALSGFFWPLGVWCKTKSKFAVVDMA